MGYALTIQRVPLGPDFRARLGHALEPLLAEARAVEIEQAVERLFDGAAHRREVPVDSLAQLRAAESHARQTAVAYEGCARRAAIAKGLYEEATGGKVEGAVAHYTNASFEAERAKDIALAAQDAALAVKARAKRLLDPAATAHIGESFDNQIQRSLDAVVVLSPAVGGAIKAIQFQVAGHVEDDGTGFVSVHVWPVE